MTFGACLWHFQELGFPVQGPTPLSALSGGCRIQEACLKVDCVHLVAPSILFHLWLATLWRHLYCFPKLLKKPFFRVIFSARFCKSVP